MSFEEISARMESLPAEQVLASVLELHTPQEVCFTCSFQAEDMIVLNLLRKHLPNVPVLFLETGYHFAETYAFRDSVSKDWNLNLVNVLPEKTVAQQESEFGLLYQSEPTRCCQLRKVDPLLKSLEPYSLWFTGLRREQSPTRKNLKKLELHKLPSGKSLWKVSLLADWSWGDVWSYTASNRIAFLPLYDQGFRSIGCQPCTAIPDDPNNPRAGRWGGKKLECGIHTFSEKQSNG